MGCGCGGARAERRVNKQIVATPNQQGVLSGLNNSPEQEALRQDAQRLTEERRKIEKLRRDKILEAIGIPKR